MSAHPSAHQSPRHPELPRARDTDKRPTPQPPTEPGRPRFQDRALADLPSPDANPYVHSHRTFSPKLLPADRAWTFRGKWPDIFGREAPLHVEIGCGNGFFAAGLAAANPDINLVAIEIRYKRVVQTMMKVDKAGLQNVVVARYHAAFLDDLFEPGTVEALYVNHPDPWPKSKHEKNRLISRWFLTDVAALLRPGGVFRLKSDHRPNIDRVEEILADQDQPTLPLTITGRSNDIEHDGAPWPADIETNYQRKFKRKGEPVYGIELRRDA